MDNASDCDSCSTVFNFLFYLYDCFSARSPVNCIFFLVCSGRSWCGSLPFYGFSFSPAHLAVHLVLSAHFCAMLYFYFLGVSGCSQSSPPPAALSEQPCFWVFPSYFVFVHVPLYCFFQVLSVILSVLLLVVLLLRAFISSFGMLFLCFHLGGQVFPAAGAFCGVALSLCMSFSVFMCSLFSPRLCVLFSARDLHWTPGFPSLPRRLGFSGRRGALPSVVSLFLFSFSLPGGVGLPLVSVSRARVVCPVKILISTWCQWIIQSLSNGS